MTFIPAPIPIECQDAGDKGKGNKDGAGICKMARDRRSPSKYLPANVTNMNANPPRRPNKILLVKDDTEVRTLMRIVLEGSSYQIWEASDCLEALNIWKRNGPLIDLLLADLVMPSDATSQLTSLSNLLTSLLIKSIVRCLAR